MVVLQRDIYFISIFQDTSCMGHNKSKMSRQRRSISTFMPEKPLPPLPTEEEIRDIPGEHPSILSARQIRPPPRADIPMDIIYEEETCNESSWRTSSVLHLEWPIKAVLRAGRRARSNRGRIGGETLTLAASKVPQLTGTTIQDRTDQVLRGIGASK